jgi:hypothetical protein
MEIQVKLEIQETSRISSKDDVAKLIQYMSGVGAIIFEEQFDLIGISLSEEVKQKLKLFSQAHPDFFSCLEVFDETQNSLVATFIAGWDGGDCAKELKVILSMFDGLDFTIS